MTREKIRLLMCLYATVSARTMISLKELAEQVKGKNKKEAG